MRYSLLLFALLLLSPIYARGSDPVVLAPKLTHVDNVPPADLEAIVQYLNRRTYTDSGELAQSVRFAFQKYGYFKVRVEEPLIAPQNENGTVVVSLAVSSGDKYRLALITFKDSGVFSTDELRMAFPIKDGDIFDREKIGKGLENLRRIYGSKGYVNFSAVPDTQADEQAHTIALIMDIDAGSVFRLGKLIVRGEESEPGAREKLLNTWKSYQGRIYDYRLLYQFLQDIKARPDVKPDQIFQIQQDTESHSVNILMTLVKPPAF